jgi:type IV pilus assembly protein PilB
MVDMGVPAYLVAGSVIGILAQRLVRVVCSKCKQPYTPRPQELEAAGISPEQAASGNLMKGRGCNHCGNSGYRGRLGVFELLAMNSRIRELAFQGASSQDIRQEAVKGGMTSLYDDGIRKVLDGITTIEEVFRIAKRDEG